MGESGLVLAFLGGKQAVITGVEFKVQPYLAPVMMLSPELKGVVPTGEDRKSPQRMPPPA